MTLETIVEYIEILLNLVLVIRLFSLRLGRVYAIFTVYLLTDLFAYIVSSCYAFDIHPVDYRILYIGTRVVDWVLSLGVIYALLSAILKSLPGILGYSKRLLNFVFAAAFVVSATVVAMNNAIQRVEAWRDTLDRVLAITYIVDQTIGATVLLVLAVMLAFFLWFPVVVPRNLAVFSVGYVVYFFSITASLFLQGAQSAEGARIISVVLTLITCVCYAYWAIFLSKAGESVPVWVGHHWQADEQKRLMHRLEEVNGVLLQTLASKKAI
jgi:hypothetical protein